MPPVARTFGRRDTVMFGACILLSIVARTLPATVRDPFAAAMRRTIVAPLIALQRDAEASRRAWLERERVSLARDSVFRRSQELAEVQGENERLRRLLGLGRALRWGFVPADVMHGRAPGEEYIVTLSAGARAGIQASSPVVAPEGLVGMVKTVDPTMSIAIVWAHPDFRVSAMAEDGTAFGIVGPHLGEETERFLLEMHGVPFRSTLTPGTAIVSSGLGGVYPRGIPIGTVVGELKTSEGWARTYLLRPMVMPADISTVMILQPQRATAGVENVWAHTTRLDSATRAVVAAGDSIARRAAMAELAARRADSARALAAAVSATAPPSPTSAPRASTTPARQGDGRVDPPAAATSPIRRDGAPPVDTSARRDEGRRDTTRRDTTRRDTTHRDTTRRDTTRRDTTRRDSAASRRGPDSAPRDTSRIVP